MIKYQGNGPTGSRVIGLGLSEENVKRLKNNMPILVKLDDFGIEGTELIIHYGVTEEAIVEDLKKHGLIPRDEVQPSE